MKIALFGATGAIGQQVTEQALAAGHEVRALVRDTSRQMLERIDTVPGDIVDAEAVARAVEGTDAVIWCVGATRNAADQVPIFESGARNLVAAMRRHGVRRLVALSGAGVTVPGERKPLSGRLMSAVVKVAARHVYEAKRREFEVFSRSDLEWTLLRPPRVVNGPVTGRSVVGLQLSSSRVTQGDLAQAIVEQLRDTRYLQAAPFVSTA